MLQAFPPSSHFFTPNIFLYHGLWLSSRLSQLQDQQRNTTQFIQHDRSTHTHTIFVRKYHNKRTTQNKQKNNAPNHSRDGAGASKQARQLELESVVPEVVGREHTRVSQARHLVVLVPREKQPREHGQAERLRQQRSHSNHLRVMSPGANRWGEGGVRQKRLQFLCVVDVTNGLD